MNQQIWTNTKAQANLVLAAIQAKGFHAVIIMANNQWLVQVV